MPPPHLLQPSGLMGNWSRLERSPVQRYQGWEGGVNSGRDASEVKPLIMITNWSWLLERQAAAVGRPAFEVPPACCRVPGPLAWGDAGTMWLPVGKNVMRRQGDGAQDGWRVDGSAGPGGGGGLVGRPSGTARDGTVGWRRNNNVLCMHWCGQTVFFGYTQGEGSMKSSAIICFVGGFFGFFFSWIKMQFDQIIAIRSSSDLKYKECHCNC